jgi:biotin carboxylase
VTLCRSEEEVRRAFGHILGKVNGLGLVNESVLIQEYLEGQEYVIDMVSRDGEHKLVGIWEYDRRPANGASFVCHGQWHRIISDDPDYYGQLVEYEKKVCTALGIRNGPSHGEVKWYKEAPILVEVGSRCHGGDGLWVDVAVRLSPSLSLFYSPHRKSVLVTVKRA